MRLGAVQALLTQAQVSMSRQSTSVTAFFQNLELWQNTIPVAASPGSESRNEFKMWSNHSQQVDRTDFHISWTRSSGKSRLRALWPARALWSVGITGMHVLGDRSIQTGWKRTPILLHMVSGRAIKTLWYGMTILYVLLPLSPLF